LNYTDVKKPSEWVTDIDEKYQTPAQAFYLKNRELFVNIHNSASGVSGESISKSSATAANYKACEVQYPIGENYSIGTYSSILTNEVYVWIFNSNAVNFIYRISDKGCDIVYDGGCIDASVNPRHALTQWRAWLDVKKTCKNWAGKRLIWTDGKSVHSIDVEASIATDSFSTPFFSDWNEPCDFINLCVPSPCSCPVFEFISNKESDALLANKMVDIGFQFMYRWVYYDGRKGTWSDPSSFYSQSSATCFENEGGFSRCGRLRLDIGGPQVAWIELAYRNDNTTNWYLAERIEKYKEYNSSQEQWYERQLSEIITSPDAGYLETDNSFWYKFCNDKKCISIDVSETNRVFNPFPREPQGIIPFGQSIAFYNYKKGNCPISKVETDKFKVSIDCTEQSACGEDFVEVKVRAVIHNEYHGRNQFIYRDGGGTSDAPDDPNDTAMFGGLNPRLDGNFEYGSAYGQNFRGKVRNFIAYVEGTDYYAEMKQWNCSAFFAGGFNEWGIVSNMDSDLTKNQWRRAARRGEFFYQEATIRVPRGTRGFIRLTSHESITADQDKSTFVNGIIDLSIYKGDLVIGPSTYDDSTEEVYFDTCGVVGNTLSITDKAFIIDDNAVDGGLSIEKASAYNGYIKDCNGNPVERATVLISAGPKSTFCFTDHNGFYHGYLPDGETGDVDFKVSVEDSCISFTNIIDTSTDGDKGSNAKADFTIEDVDFCNGKYLDVQVGVKDCNGVGVRGVRVALSDGKAAVTDSFGVARFRARNNSTRDRSFRAIVMDSNGCFGRDCNNNCNYCMPMIVAAGPTCYVSAGDPITLNMGNTVINISSSELSSAGLKKGGRYKFGFVAKGDCGYLSFVNESAVTLDIPKSCDGKSKYCRLSYDFTGMVLPSWTKCISIVRTKNTNPFELQWIVDKVEYVEGRVRLTIQSLNDYNFNNFFNTNTIYQYLRGDRVEFIRDADGKYFCESLNYQILSPFHDTVLSGNEEADASFFNQIIIEDDGRIGSDLKKGAIIELQRPKECATDNEYYTICVNLPVVNGAVVNPVGVFHTFDSYKVKRKIGEFPAQEFEHHSPSDFWGDRVTDVGFVHIANEYEDEKRFGRNITISAVDDFNRFGDLEKTFDSPEQGDIIAMNITDQKVMLAICEHDNFLAQSADDLLRVSADGSVRAISASQITSDPQVKLAGKYGCQYDHIGSILFGDGWATWADVNNSAIILNDYQLAKEASFGKIGAWTTKRFQEMETWNRAQTLDINKYRFSTGYNRSNKTVLLTLKRLRDGGLDNQYEPFISPNETIVYSPYEDKFYGQMSFTPEAYGFVNVFNGKGASFVSIIQGDAWIHPTIPEEWGSFYGVPVDQVIGVCLNAIPDKEKNALAIEVQSDKMWFVRKITTEKVNFESEIPAARWHRENGKWNAEFLCNKFGRGGLYGNQENYAGEETCGYFVKVLFVRDNTDDLKYMTFDNNKRKQYDELDMIKFKFSLSEQSGFTENL
jgi:hypothetical protein